MRTGRRVVLIFSCIIAVIGFGALMYFRSTGTPMPLWDEVAMTYGGVFCVFWVFDTLGKMVSAQSRRRAASLPQGDGDGTGSTQPVPRPRPRPGPIPSQQVAVPGCLPASSEDGQDALNADGQALNRQGTTPSSGYVVRLRRVATEEMDTFQDLLDAFLNETYALEERVPAVGEDEHVLALNASALMQQQNTYCFLLHGMQGGVAAAAVVKMQEDTANVSVVYVPISLRRRGFGSETMKQIDAFFKLLHPGCRIVCEIPFVNHRAQKFLRTNGFVSDEDDISSEGENGPVSAERESETLRFVLQVSS